MNATLTAFTQTATTLDIVDVVPGGYIVHFFNDQAQFQAWLKQERAAGVRHNCQPRKQARGRQWDAKDHRHEYFFQ
jgi:hypothetical protein